MMIKSVVSLPPSSALKRGDKKSKKTSSPDLEQNGHTKNDSSGVTNAIRISDAEDDDIAVVRPADCSKTGTGKLSPAEKQDNQTGKNNLLRTSPADKNPVEESPAEEQKPAQKNGSEKAEQTQSDLLRPATNLAGDVETNPGPEAAPLAVIPAVSTNKLVTPGQENKVVPELNAESVVPADSHRKRRQRKHKHRKSHEPVDKPNTDKGTTDGEVPASPDHPPPDVSGESATKSGRHPKRHRKSHSNSKKKPNPNQPEKASNSTVSPGKKIKLTHPNEEKQASPDDPTKIKIEFKSQGLAKGKPGTSKSKWDTSSEDEDTSRKGAISYHFSDDDKPTKNPIKPESSFGKMAPAQPKVGEKAAAGVPVNKVPQANGNGAASVDAAAKPAERPSAERQRSYSGSSRSRSRSGSRSRSRSYSSDESYNSRGRRRRRRGRSYTRSYTRSRSRSYSTDSRSYSRSYSRSSRSSSRSRSRSRYRSYSRSYSSSSYYSSRSRSRSPRYTRAKYTSRAFNMGKRGRPYNKKNKNKQPYKPPQNPQQNANIQKQQETGMTKAQEMIMRLKAQKKESQEQEERAKAAIAAAASSAGITLPASAKFTQATSHMGVVTTVSTAGASSHSTTITSPQQHIAPVVGLTGLPGTDLVANTYIEASQLANAPLFVPRSIQPKEFIGPVRPGDPPEAEIPLPTGTPNSSGSGRKTVDEPEPMSMPDVPDSEAAAYKELQEQAAQHIMASSNSPQMAQAQMMAGIPAGHIPGEMHHAIPQQFLQAETTTFIDPMTGQHVQLVPHGLPLAQAGTPVEAEGQQLTEDGQPAPHEAVVKSYAHQILVSQQRALVSQAQPVFTIASSAQGVIPQAGVPIQAGTPMMMTAQMQQMAHAQAIQQAHLQAQAQQALQMQQLQQLQQAALMQPGLHMMGGMHPLLAQQHQAALLQAQLQQQAQVFQLPNGQLVNSQQLQQLQLMRFQRPM